MGYSSTGEVGTGDLDGRNLASYWTLDTAAGTVGTTKIIPLPDGEPGKDDAKLQHSWAVAVNDNGYVIGNQRYRINKGQNRPVEMFLFNLSKPGTAASLPLQDKPVSGQARKRPPSTTSTTWWSAGATPAIRPNRWSMVPTACRKPSC